MNTIKKIVVNIMAALIFVVTACDRVDDKVLVTEVTLDIMSLNMTVGESKTLTALIEPKEATNKDVLWTSSNRDVASVNDAGEVTALTQGEAKISVTTIDGGFRTSCIVAVYETSIRVTGVTFDVGDKLLVGLNEIGDNEKTIIAIVSPVDATDKYVKWNSSHPEIARITPSGRVQPLSVGQTLISAQTRDGNFFAECVVTVVAH